MFDWFHKRSEARKRLEEDIRLAESAPRLHGVNLNEWRYLGRTELAYVDDQQVPIAKASMFSFCGIEDTDRRHFVVVQRNTIYDFDKHTYVLENAALWKICERELWETVRAEPSRWLRDHMLEKHGNVWDPEAKWWTKSGSTPPQRRKPKLKLVESEKASEPNDNVVTVDFSKDRE